MPSVSCFCLQTLLWPFVWSRTSWQAPCPPSLHLHQNPQDAVLQEWPDPGLGTFLLTPPAHTVNFSIPLVSKYSLSSNCSASQSGPVELGLEPSGMMVKMLAHYARLNASESLGRAWGICILIGSPKSYLCALMFETCWLSLC